MIAIVLFTCVIAANAAVAIWWVRREVILLQDEEFGPYRDSVESLHPSHPSHPSHHSQ
jgi:hypothetical protein